MTADLDSYVELLEGAKERGLPVVLGIEADYIPEAESETRNLLAAYPFDVVLGSVHWLDDWGVGLPEQRHLWQDRDVAEVYREYFTVSERAVRSGLFDVLTHPDLVKIFGHRPPEPPVPLWERLAAALRDASVAAEVSTAGWRKPVGEIYPEPGFIHLLRAKEVPITLASDAHRPHDVGHRFPEALALLQAAGYSEVSTYRRRVRTPVPIRFDRR
jgi:histidinol-phosphatase (PHP family)